MRDPPTVKPDDISEANYHNYFVIGVVEDKENIEFSQLLMLPMKILKLELKLHTVAEIMSLVYQAVVYFVKLHLYWL